MAADDVVKKAKVKIESSFNKDGFDKASAAAKALKKELDSIGKLQFKSFEKMSKSISDNVRKALEKAVKDIPLTLKISTKGGRSRGVREPSGAAANTAQVADFDMLLKSFKNLSSTDTSQLSEIKRHFEKNNTLTKEQLDEFERISENLEEGMREEAKKFTADMRKTMRAGAKEFEGVFGDSVRDNALEILRDIRRVEGQLETASFGTKGLGNSKFVKTLVDPFIRHMRGKKAAEIVGRQRGQAGGFTPKDVSKFRAEAFGFGNNKLVSMIAHPMVKAAVAIGQAAWAAAKIWSEFSKRTRETTKDLMMLNARTGDTSKDLRGVAQTIPAVVGGFGDFIGTLNVTRDGAKETQLALASTGLTYEKVFSEGSLHMRNAIVAAGALGLTFSESATLIGEASTTFGIQAENQLQALDSIRRASQKTELTQEMFRRDVWETSKQLFLYGATLDQVTESLTQVWKFSDLPTDLGSNLSKSILEATQKLDSAHKIFLTEMFPKGEDGVKATLEKRKASLESDRSQGKLSTVGAIQLKQIERIMKSGNYGSLSARELAFDTSSLDQRMDAMIKVARQNGISALDKTELKAVLTTFGMGEENLPIFQEKMLFQDSVAELERKIKLLAPNSDAQKEAQASLDKLRGDKEKQQEGKNAQDTIDKMFEEAKTNRTTAMSNTEYLGEIIGTHLDYATAAIVKALYATSPPHAQRAAFLADKEMRLSTPYSKAVNEAKAAADAAKKVQDKVKNDPEATKAKLDAAERRVAESSAELKRLKDLGTDIGSAFTPEAVDTALAKLLNVPKTAVAGVAAPGDAAKIAQTEGTPIRDALDTQNRFLDLLLQVTPKNQDTVTKLMNEVKLAVSTTGTEDDEKAAERIKEFFNKGFFDQALRDFLKKDLSTGTVSPK